ELFILEMHCYHMTIYISFLLYVLALVLGMP
ncbi:unnamed protein product, partial [Cuscuta campestris]